MTDIGRKIELAISGIVFILTIYVIFANTVPEIQSSGNDLNSSGVPFGQLFASDGVVVLLIMLSLVFVVLKIPFKNSK